MIDALRSMCLKRNDTARVTAPDLRVALLQPGAAAQKVEVVPAPASTNTAHADTCAHVQEILEPTPAVVMPEVVVLPEPLVVEPAPVAAEPIIQESEEQWCARSRREAGFLS